MALAVKPSDFKIEPRQKIRYTVVFIVEAELKFHEAKSDFFFKKKKVAFSVFKKKFNIAKVM